MTRIIYHIGLVVIAALLAFVGGSWPGRLYIHKSGNASYVVGSHCHISADVTNKEFTELTEWCTALHNK